MAKYTEQARKIRQLSREYIPELIKNSPLTSKEIIDQVQKKFPQNCDESVICECGKSRNRPEWKHQILWAIQDCRAKKQLIYNQTNKKYSKYTAPNE